ncbi:MAG: carboxypeptidase-like regulatory domain-containing protein [Prolixibacteraceae bacterium]
MKKYTFILLLIPYLSFSQISLSGRIFDEKKNPVAYANVFIQPDNSSSIIAYCQADGTGYYILKTSKSGKFLLNFSAMSYKTTTFPVEFGPESQDLTRDAVMIFEPIPLNEVIISANKSMIIKKDTIIFNAGAFAQGNERVLEDLLKKIPGLVVDDDGKISVGNREVEKVMIDGDDLFEKGYRILTKNMPAYPVSKVEVYQHYSNNKLLKGIENSEKVALNLKLKEDSKRQWFGNASLGYGPENGNHYQTYANLMNFGGKTKFYGIVSLNNVGEDATGDINFLIRPASESDEAGSIGENQNARSVIDISTFSPNLKQNRLLFNKSGVYALNAIFNPTSKVKVKTLAFFNTDENNFYNSIFESTSIGSTSFSNFEDHRLKNTQVTGFGKIVLTDDISKNQTLEYFGKFNHSDEKKFNKLNFNDSLSNEILSNNNTLIDHKLLYTNRLRNNKVLLISGRYIYESAPQNFSLDKFYYQDLFPEDSGVSLVQQNCKNQMQFGGFAAHLMDKKKNGDLLEIKFGNEFRLDVLQSEFKLMNEKIIIDEPPMYQNYLTYSTNDIYLISKYNKQFKNFGIDFSLDFHQLFNYLKQSGKVRYQDPFFINPKIGGQWRITKNDIIITSYSYNHQNSSVLDVSNKYINTRFRSFSKGMGEFNQLNLSTFLLNYSHGNWGSKFFANSFLIYNKNHDFYSTNTIVSRNYSQSEKILLKNKSYLLFTSNIDQYLKVITSNIKINFGYSFSEYKNMVNNLDLRSIRGQNINYGLELRSSFHGWFNFHFGSKWNYCEIKTSIRNSFTDNMSFLDLALSFSKKLDLQIKGERYFFGSLDKENNKYNFLDFEARYNVVENKLSLSLSGKNLLNTETFRNYSIDDISISRTEYKLLPRFLLIAAEYRF